METWREIDWHGKFVPKEEIMKPEKSKIFTLTEDNFFDIEKEIIAGIKEHRVPKSGKTKKEDTTDTKKVLEYL